MMNKQKDDGKLIVSVLAVCFAVTLLVMIYALCRPQTKPKAEFVPPLLKAKHSRACLMFRRSLATVLLTGTI